MIKDFSRSNQRSLVQIKDYNFETVVASVCFREVKKGGSMSKKMMMAEIKARGELANPK